jgi:hypothetical protein
MHINNYNPTPPQKILDQCHQVLVADPKTVMWKMKKWCRENDLSLMWAEMLDTSDASYTHDYIAAFWFIDAQDATAFTLKFK